MNMMDILRNINLNNMIFCILNYFFVPPDKSGGNSNRGFLFQDKSALSSFIKIFPNNQLNQSNNMPEAEFHPALAGWN